MQFRLFCVTCGIYFPVELVVRWFLELFVFRLRFHLLEAVVHVESGPQILPQARDGEESCLRAASLCAGDEAIVRFCSWKDVTLTSQMSILSVLPAGRVIILQFYELPLSGWLGGLDRRCCLRFPGLLGARGVVLFLFVLKSRCVFDPSAFRLQNLMSC